MSLYTISNEHLTVTVSSRAAELQSIRGADGVEYLWQGDPAYWSDRAPTLFPLIARQKEGCYCFGGKRYPIRIHGLSPYADFSCTQHSGSALELTMRDTPETLRQYPWHFRFTVRFRLEEARLWVEYCVENRDETQMYFAIGGHPGFRVPLAEGLTFTDYRLRFSAPCRPMRVGFTPEVLVSGIDTPYPLDGDNAIPLRHTLFHDDAIVLRDTCREVILESRKDPHRVVVSFPEMPYVGFWHAVDTDAPYVCIEPWSALPGRSDAITELAAQPDLTVLAAGQAHHSSWSISIL